LIYLYNFHNKPDKKLKIGILLFFKMRNRLVTFSKLMNRVARFWTAGLPDFKILIDLYYFHNKPEKTLKIGVLLFFGQ
jgi:hypothetical protein